MRGPEHGERVMVAARESEKAGAARRLCVEQKSDFLAVRAGVWFEPAGNSIVDLFARSFSTAVVCFKVPRHRVSAGGESDLKCFGMARDTVLKQFARAAFDAGTDVELSGEAAENVARWVT